MLHYWLGKYANLTQKTPETGKEKHNTGVSDTFMFKKKVDREDSFKLSQRFPTCMLLLKLMI